MNVMEEFCLQISKRRVVRRSSGTACETLARYTPEGYFRWRASEVQAQFLKNFDPEQLKDRDLLDFGCGEGQLSFFVADFEPKSITGVELDPGSIQSAVKRLQEQNLQLPIQFLLSTNPKTICLPDASMDVILCFDVLEHVMSYSEILQEWRRVLRPNGFVWIWWMPWWHPYGAHITSLVPLPWAHVLFSDRVLVNTCARVYELPQFKPCLWDLDESGKKKPNKWRTLNRLPCLNRLTIRRFEKVCRGSGFEIRRRKITGFGGSLLAKTTRVFTHVPLLREFFCSYVIYELRRSRAQRP